MKALIVEDELSMAQYLENSLNRLYPQITIVKVLNKLDALAHYLQTEPIDILFLDIQVQDKNSIDFLTEHDLFQNIHIVITSAHASYALKAYNIHPFHYLLKPIDLDELQEIVDKLILKINSNQTPTVVKIRTKMGWQLISSDEILYCQANGAYTHIQVEKENFISSKNLKYFEEKLSTLIRVHHSYLVNPKFITNLEELKWCVLMNGEKIPISSRKKNVLKAFFSD